MPRDIELLAFPDVMLLDVTGPLQVFASANDYAIANGEMQPYHCRVVASGGSLVRSSAGLEIAVDSLPPDTTDVDTLIVAGGIGVEAAGRDEALLDWLRNRADRARRLASVCRGAFLSASAGLLDGHRVVTHWKYCSELERLHPEIKVERDPIFLRDGRIWSSAGVSAGIDLALALVEEDLGVPAALAVARSMVTFVRRSGGQAQFIAGLAMKATNSRFENLHASIVANLSQDLSTKTLAKLANMSERSFGRHYVNATGITPARAVERFRVECARQLLIEVDGHSVKRIAAQCGFRSEETMRRSFRKIVGTSPQDYRERFGR